MTRALLPTIRPETALLARQFLRFGTVGMAGFVVDVACVYLLRGWTGLVWAGLLAYLAAATTTWALNRAWTFRDSARGPLLRQWLMFLGANGVGFVLNRGTYLALITLVPLCAQQPVFAIAAGVLAGMFANFTLSRRLVFR